jgi:predicted kinase
MPTLYMLIGVPGSGKTTWIKGHRGNAVVLSTDDKVEAEAERLGKTYSDVFQSIIKQATREMNDDLNDAIREKRDIIWDQTNITRKSRKGKLDKIPGDYRKVAVFFPVPPDLRERLASRPGKVIPEPVIISMINQIEPPSKDEGFDEIVNT